MQSKHKPGINLRSKDKQKIRFYRDLKPQKVSRKCNQVLQGPGT